MVHNGSQPSIHFLISLSPKSVIVLRSNLLSGGIEDCFNSEECPLNTEMALQYFGEEWKMF
jgi:hypothetical protein